MLVIRDLRLLGSLLVLLTLLAACGEEDEPESGADAGTSTATVAVAAPEPASPTTETTVTATVEPATPTIEATSTPSIDSSTTPPSSEADAPAYEWLTAWDAKWEKLGSMVLGPDGRLYVDDYVRHQVMIFGLDGSEHPPLAYETTHPEFVELRNDLAIGTDGRIYLLEQAGAARVQVFEQDGTLVTAWGGTVGFEEDSLFDARMIAVAPDGRVFTSRPGLLQQFTSDGVFVAAWDRAGEALFPAEVWDMKVVGDTLYVAGTGFRDQQAVILTFDLEGNLIAEPMVIGEADAEDRIFPGSLAIGPDRNLFIADPFTREIIVLTPAGEELTRWALDPTDQRFPVVEVAVDDAGLVYVADGGQKAIHVYGPQQAL
jgi:hypothetical protein